MKIIDLLNKIANGEEVPKKIKYKRITLSYAERDQDYKRYYGGYLFNHLFGKDNLDFLNDEVEILEEEKEIPEKLNKQHFHKKQRQLANKINEIIDYIVIKE